jgi:hypothetical protein
MDVCGREREGGEEPRMFDASASDMWHADLRLSGAGCHRDALGHS